MGEVEYYASRLREIQELDHGKAIHAQISARYRKVSTFLENLLVKMYGQCGSIEDAKAVFDGIRPKNVYSWNIMIAAYAVNGHLIEAIGLFQEMAVKPSRVTFLSVLAACAQLRCLEIGQEIHARALCSGFGSDTTVANSLINLYSKCQRLESARYVFSVMPDRNVISWTSMIDACVQCGDHREARALFLRMDLEGVKPNEMTFSNLLSACSLLVQGRSIHARLVACGYATDVGVCNSLVSMYSRCGSLEEATNVFENMPARDRVSWTAVITAYARVGHRHHSKSALECFRKMVEQGVAPDEITYISVLGACSCAGCLATGRMIHEDIISQGLDALLPVRNSLVSMYGKCGRLDEARDVFNFTKGKSIVSWTAMISAYAQHGHSEEAQSVFQRMELEGIQPSEVSFTSILYACSHAGSLSQGHRFFLAMVGDERDISPLVEHYHCLIDLLSRSGQLEAAEELIRTMPFEADIVPWIALLGTCKAILRLEVGMRVVEEILLKLTGSKSPGPYILVSNFCAAAGRWDYVVKVRKLMSETGVTQRPGCSFVEVGNEIHEFVAGDSSHECYHEIHEELKSLHSRMKQAGYVPDTSQVLWGGNQEEKEKSLCFHSERLAISFALVASPPGTPVWVTKNLRVCTDCHTATKFIAKLARREIVVRDSSRFHRFSSDNGGCSCGDYW
ncbi:pentatricopeptide repeat-containing protein At3g12770-like [Selaginella moellendorffii]|uniref:pentatricopeptide repeat-containing protein At3g12770-like n=1 Tax=Selaginella moellendorffii TaxID=88036 RepID=UPI000D1C3201|nr:pentatricopeptide repeat-containing protein At3g12770-like [Selaginella moellendorffii]|eukprot:XP_024544697.1 pentatricopeptide repeat-containing protein At3g12770-like [Selaginella moellendorffii]